jgi:acetyl-CoA acetyltransferase
MQRRVAVIGVGYTPFRPISPDLSFKEMMFEAAQKAYEEHAKRTSPMEGASSISTRQTT